MSLKLERHLTWSVFQIGISLKLELTQMGTTLKMPRVFFQK